MTWPTFEPSILMNMFISASFGLVAGLIGGWLAHWWARKRDIENAKRQELLYWRQKLDDIGKSLDERFSNFRLYTENYRRIDASPYEEEQIRLARGNIERLERELGITKESTTS